MFKLLLNCSLVKTSKRSFYPVYIYIYKSLALITAIQ